MRTRVVARVTLAAHAVMMLCAAQPTTTSLLGTVNDASGAAMPGVVLRLVSLDTNFNWSGSTNKVGVYSFVYLPAGSYRILASREGFKTAQADRVVLQVDQVARVDFTMTVGDVSDTVDVSSAGALLQSENASVGTTIDSAKILDLPLNGRNFIQLAQLIPGVQPGTPGSITVRRGRASVGQSDPGYGSTGVSASGARDTANRFYLDGVEIMDYDAMTYAFAPSLDSLAEFGVQTSNYSAAYGGAPGAQINMITRSGTNANHGTLWEFNRNDELTQSYDAIAGRSVASPRLNRNQFGANLGGPVRVPGTSGDSSRTFFFFNWESGYLAQGASPQFKRVPTEAQRSGDFRGLKDSHGDSLTLQDTLHIGIAGNQIPKSALSPQALTFLEFEPLPNTNTGAYNYVTTPASAVSRQRNYTGRFDHAVSGKDLLSGRYVFNDTYEAGVPVWGHDERNNLGRTQNISVAWIRNLAPALVNEARGGWHRFSESEAFGTSNDPRYNIAGKMGLPFVSALPAEYGPPSISIGGPDGAYNMYDLQRQIGPRTRSNSISPFTDTLSWRKGRHSLKYGGELDYRGVTFEQARNPRGQFSFDGTYTGSALADFLLGYIRSDNVNPAHTSTDLYEYWFAGFINDDWKITPRLSLTFGLRYDYFQRYKQKDDRFVDIQLNGFVAGDLATTKTSPYGRELLAPDRSDFGPRFGFAWRPRYLGETVVRAGYGIYYTPEISNAIFAMAEGAQATTGAAVTGNIVGAPNVFFSNPFVGAQTTGALNFAVANDQNMRDSYIQQWSVSLERESPGKTLVTATYAGSKGTDLIVTYDDLNRPLQVVDPRAPGLAPLDARRPNQIFPHGVTGDKSVGNSIYHSLQLKAERRFNTGLSFLTAYTFSKSISGPGDIGGQVGGGYFIGSPQDYFNARSDRSLSGFDVTHRFVQTILYKVPVSIGLRGAPGFLLRNWRISAIAAFQSGFPAPVMYGVDTTGTGIESRPDVVAGQQGNLPGSQRTWQRWFNTAVFVASPFGRFGNSPRTGSIRLPGVENMDFSIGRSMRLRERWGLAFRTEFFNLFSHFNPDPQSVDLNLRSLTFGSIGGGVQGITTRVIQLGAKLNF